MRLKNRWLGGCVRRDRTFMKSASLKEPLLEMVHSFWHSAFTRTNMSEAAGEALSTWEAKRENEQDVSQRMEKRSLDAGNWHYLRCDH